MGLLGTGSYEVIAQGRGGAPLVEALKWSSLTFQRRLDDMSTTTVTCVTGSSPELGRLDAWRHELSVVRDQQEVWVGPLVTPSWEPEVVTLQANDLFFWFERRLLEIDRDFVNADAGQIFTVLAQDALSRDNSMGIVLSPSSTGVPATRSVSASERRRAADVLRELARTAIDFTAIGRTIRCGGQEVPTEVAFTLVDDTLRSPKLTSNGTDCATEATILGQNVAGAAVAGVAGAGTAEFGLVQQSYSESTIQDTSSAQAAARSHWEFAKVPPRSLSGVLTREAPVDFGDLIPGARVHVELSSLDAEVNADFRLLQVDVTVTPSDQGQQEEVAITLEPVGTVSGDA